MKNYQHKLTSTLQKSLTSISAMALLSIAGTPAAYANDKQTEIYNGAVIEPFIPSVVAPVNVPAVASSNGPQTTNASDNGGGDDIPDSTAYLKDAMAQQSVNFEISAETTDLLGDSVDLGTGSISFSHTDVSLKGNFAIPVAVKRRFHDGNYKVRSTAEFGDWSLDVPAIHTTLLKNGMAWHGAWGDGKECSGVQEPPAYNHNGEFIQPESYFNGNSVLAGSGRESLLYVGLPDQTYTTKSLLKITCYTRADGAGEGYQAVTPQGVIYRFDVPHLVKQFSLTGENRHWPLYQAYLRVSTVTDRFGNTVTYNYEDRTTPNNFVAKRLSSIEGSDGRKIDFTYYTGDDNYLVRTVTANGKTHTYNYDKVNQSPTLATVDLPRTAQQIADEKDALKWTYDLKELNYLHNFQLFENFKTAEKRCETTTSTLTGTVTHPYGVQGTFVLKPILNHRSMAPVARDVNRQAGLDCFATMALFSKTLSGKGVDSLAWGYSYSQNTGSYDDVPTNAVAPAYTVDGYEGRDLKNTTVTAPDNSKTVHIFSRRWDYLEGTKVGSVSFDTDGTTQLQKTGSGFQAYTVTVSSTGLSRGNIAQMLSKPLATKNTITDNTDTTYQTLYGVSSASGTPVFNAYGVPELKTEIFTFGNTTRKRTTKTEYQHDTDQWVLNLPTKQSLLDDSGTYQQVSRTEYTPATDATPFLAKKLYSFNQLASTYWYYPNGTVEKQQSADITNRWVKFGVYEQGIPTTVTLPGRYDAAIPMTASRVINGDGTIHSATDFEGYTTTYSYDALGRVTLIDPTDASWDNTVIAYEENSGADFALLQTVSRGNYRKTNTLDGLLRPILSKEWDNASEQTTQKFVNQSFNAYNKVTFASFPSNLSTEANGTTNTYDGLQRLTQTSVTGQGNQSIDYLAGNKQKITNFNGYTTETTYLAFGSPAYQQMLSSVAQIDSAENVTTSQSINLYGNVTSITQSGKHKEDTISHTQHMAYDSQQRLCKMTRGDVGQTVYSYYNNGQIHWQASGTPEGANDQCSDEAAYVAANKITTTYDFVGDIHQVSYADSTPTSTYLLTKQGDLQRLTSGSVIQDYQYDSKHQLTYETLTYGSFVKSLDYDYNSLGHLQALTYPDDVVGKVEFAPNALGQATQAIGPNNYEYAKTASYHPSGSINTFTFGNGVVHNTELNTSLQPQTITDALGGVNRMKLGYEYDNQSNITKLTNHVDSAFSLTDLDYDGLDRLVSTTGGRGIGSSSLSYDAIGNITLYSSKGALLDYNYDLTSNRLTGVSDTVGSVSYNFTDGYDARGNVISNGNRVFDYNLANQMTGSQGNTYVYDGHNRRVMTNDGKGVSYSMYSKSGRLLYRESPDGPISYIFMGDKLVAKDGFMPPAKSSDMHYKPFGDSLETPRNGVGYSGHMFDTDLGLSYMQARYYDPVIGRFYANDPIGFRDVHSFNRYVYTNNNPYKYTDPNGMAPQFRVRTAPIKPPPPLVSPSGLPVQGGNTVYPNSGDRSRDDTRRSRSRDRTRTDRAGNPIDFSGSSTTTTEAPEALPTVVNNYIPPPKTLPGFPDATPAKPKTSVQGGGGKRKRWKDKKGNIYEWDSQHGTVEKYNKRGKHQGEYDPDTAEETKPADKTRKVDP